jgi:asparaginyl-tRNA synthetase
VRTNLFHAVFRLRSVASFAIHEFFQKQGFIYTHTPIITGNDGEGAGQMFNVTTLDLNHLPKNDDGEIDYKKDFFAKRTNLTVTGQLEAEAYALAFKNVYTFGPTFRAENSNTQRHASEFWMIEPEMAFADLDKDMEVAEEMVKYVIQYVFDKLPEEMEFFNKFVEKGLKDKLLNVLNQPFARVTHHKAIEILKNAKEKFENQPEFGKDISTEHEKYLTEKHFKSPVFVTDWPKDIKAFYMRLNDDQETVAAMDLLVPGSGELIGGSQREERLDILEKRMEEMHVPKEDLNWYLDLRKYGGCKHAGYGMGFERLVMYLSGVENIRDVIPFPRTPKHCEF